MPFDFRLNVGPRGMSHAIKRRNKQQREIASLISQSFDATNQSQLETIKKLTLEFESLHHQMQLMSMMVDLTYSAIGLMMSSVMLPVGWMVAPFMSYIVPLGFLAKYIGSHLKPELATQLKDLKSIYEWALSDNHDVNKTLAVPEVQKMLKLLAQYCDKDFLCRWPSVLNPGQASTGFFSGVYNTLIYPISYLWSDKTSPEKTDIVPNLKSDAEQGRLRLGYADSIKAAIDFLFSPDFRGMYKIQVQQQLSSLLEMIKAGEHKQDSNNSLPNGV